MDMINMVVEYGHKISIIWGSKGFDNGTLMLKNYHKHRYTRLFEIFGNRLFSALAELFGTTNNKNSERKIIYI